MRVGRNEPCPCGSGRKFKRCCLDSLPSPQEGQFEAELEASEPGGGEIDSLDDFASALAVLVATEGPEAITPRIRDFLAENLECLLFFLNDLLGEESGPHDEDGEALIAAYQRLLEIQLANLRIRLERDYEWAKELLASFEERLIGAIHSGEASPDKLMLIGKAMFEAKIPPGNALAAAAGKRLGPGNFQGEADPDVAGLATEIAHQFGDDPFLICNALLSFSHLSSAALRIGAIEGLLTAPEASMREGAALAVLDSDPEVRRATAMALVKHCRGVTRATLRRLITIREWFVEPERPLIDEAVKNAQLAGIEAAPWAPGARVAEIHASAPDGAGGQMAMIVTRADDGHRLSGLLFKWGKGIADAWTMEPESRRSINQLIKDGSREMRLVRVSRSYFDGLVGYYLRAGLQHNVLPMVRLLKVAELLQASQWRPGEAGWRELLAGLIAQIPGPLLAPDSVRGIIASSAAWGMKRGWAASWVEEGQEVIDLLDGLNGGSNDVVRDAVLDQVVEKRRAIWAERFTLTALWMREAKGVERLPWERFSIVAQRLTEEMPLREIPLMNEIAQATVSP